MLKGHSNGVVGENVREMRRKGLSERDAVMVSLKKAKKRGKKNNVLMDEGPSATESYPYSSRLDLDHEMLDKLGVGKLPAHGTKMTIQAKAKVHSKSEDVGSDGKTRRRMTLQMTHMKVG